MLSLQVLILCLRFKDDEDGEISGVDQGPNETEINNLLARYPSFVYSFCVLIVFNYLIFIFIILNEQRQNFNFFHMYYFCSYLNNFSPGPCSAFAK